MNEKNNHKKDIVILVVCIVLLFLGCLADTVAFWIKAAEEGTVMQLPDNLLLDLGSVNMIAEVTINSKVLRPLWCAPYAIDIADYVRKGENDLQIKVTSTWFNRLVYDASKPESERKTWTINGPSAKSELKKYGLLGPVVLKSE